MKKFVLSLLFLGLIATPALSFAGASYSFPADGGRQLSATIDTANNVSLIIGYLSITSTSVDGSLNPTQDQADADQLADQIAQLYLQSYQNFGPSAAPKSTPTQSAYPTSCQIKRSSKWRNNP